MEGCEDCRRKDAAIIDVANRLTAASEVLGQLAQRDGRVNEINRLRHALQRIANSGLWLGSSPRQIAEEALRLCN